MDINSITRKVVTAILVPVPVIIILFLYWKSARLLKELSDDVLISMQLKAKDLYIYSFMTIFTCGPLGVYLTLQIMNVDTSGKLWSVLLPCTTSLGGLSNSLIYFLQRKSLVGQHQHTKVEKLELLANERSHSLDNLLCREPRSVCIDLSLGSTPPNNFI